MSGNNRLLLGRAGLRRLAAPTLAAALMVGAYSWARPPMTSPDERSMPFPLGTVRLHAS